MDFDIYIDLRCMIDDVEDIISVDNSTESSRIISKCETGIYYNWSNDDLIYLKPLLLLELIQRLPYYNLIRLYDILLDMIKDIIGFEFKFTGKLGIRRKYQKVYIPQLTVQFISSDNMNNKNDIEEGGEGEGDDNNFITNITLNSLDDNNDILELPQLDDIQIYNLNYIEQLILLSKCLLIISNIPEGDELALEFINAIVNIYLTIDNKNINWLIMSIILWLRCKTEYYRTKTIERATLQLHSLDDNYYSMLYIYNTIK